MFSVHGKRGEEMRQARQAGHRKEVPALFGWVGCVVRCQRFRAAATNVLADPRRRVGGPPPWWSEGVVEGGSSEWYGGGGRTRTVRLCKAASTDNHFFHVVKEVNKDNY
jgi:hypothetical protein